MFKDKLAMEQERSLNDGVRTEEGFGRKVFYFDDLGSNTLSHCLIIPDYMMTDTKLEK